MATGKAFALITKVVS